MSKLPKAYQFVDLSDYGRFVARWIANQCKHSSITAIHLTTLFIISGILAIISMVSGYYVLAGLLLILKSILDAADGELARQKKTPSYIGRYYDSIADIVLNFLFLWTICYG
jgi:phosphatidylglycerophosphate synthase